MLSLAAVALLAAAPPSIADAYRLLAKEKKVQPVLLEEKGHWRYAASDGETFQDKAAPIVDVPNGYIELGYQLMACSERLQLALFVGGARRFVLVSDDADCIEGARADVKAYELKGGSLVDVTKELGDLSRVAWTDFLDDKLPADARTEAETVKPATDLLFDLPRTGTTVLVKLVLHHEPGTGTDQSYGPRAAALAAKYQRASAIELLWSTKDAKFTRGAKRPMAPAPRAK
jgi:hypothetical protein